MIVVSAYLENKKAPIARIDAFVIVFSKILTVNTFCQARRTTL
jgi:hypothetical protein